MGAFRGLAPGPTLLLVGSLHGNEPAGLSALERVVLELRELDRERAGPPLASGEVVALVGNPFALEARRRFLDCDLNRVWQSQRIETVAAAGPASREEACLLALRHECLQARERSRGPLYALDLHTTSGGGPPFVNLSGPREAAWLADDLPLPKVLGVDQHLHGTLVEWLQHQGFASLGIEGGQHQDARAVDHLEAVIWLALESRQLLSAEHLEGAVGQRIAWAREVLRRASRGLPSRVEILERYALESATDFVMQPGFESFQPVAAGTLLAHYRGAEVRSPIHARILMPLYQSQGEEGFFLVREVGA